MVADDHPIVREGIVANLKRQRDLKVIGEANDGAQVLEFIKQNRPDIALLDLRMPRMNGLEFCEHLRADSALKSVPILLISAQQKDTESVVADKAHN